MVGRTHRTQKQPVARRATPDRQVKLSPPSETLKTLVSADAVLTARHAVLSWDVIVYELGGGVDRGTLSRVASKQREPSVKLIKKLNSAYGCHLHVKTVKANIPVCEVCDEPYTPSHKCKSQPRARQPDPVIRVKKLKRIIDGAPFSPEMKRELLALFGVQA